MRSPTYRYSAAKELNEYISERKAEQPAEVDGEAYAGDGVMGSTGNDWKADSQLRALTRGKKNEDMQNMAANQQKTGEAVRFGDTIQLQHVQSGECTDREYEKLQSSLSSIN